MGKGINRLPASFHKLKPGLHSDGNCLYLQVTIGPHRNRRLSWIFRYTLAGRRSRDMGLGGTAYVSLSKARDLAREYRQLVKSGIDPINHRDAEIAKNLAASAAVMTFDEATKVYIQQHGASWTNPNHAREWRNTVAAYASPVIGKMGVADIATAHISKILDPIWNDKPTTAQRVRGRIESILGWCTVKGYRVGDNPARWRGHLQNAMPAPNKVRKVEHLAALPYQELPAFMAQLRERNGMAALALEFAVLTCVRSVDVLNARRADVDRATGLWTIPSFSKTAKEHRVPLSAPALAVLDKARDIASGIGGDVSGSVHVFPNDVTGARLNKNVMLGLLDRMGRKGAMTTHGCRATFRTWAQEQTNFPWEVSELALGHTVGTKVERAYARGDALKKRVAIMEAWAQFCAKPQQPGKVIPLQGRGA